MFCNTVTCREREYFAVETQIPIIPGTAQIYSDVTVSLCLSQESERKQRAANHRAQRLWGTAQPQGSVSTGTLLCFPYLLVIIEARKYVVWYARKSKNLSTNSRQSALWQSGCTFCPDACCWWKRHASYVAQSYYVDVSSVWSQLPRTGCNKWI